MARLFLLYKEFAQALNIVFLLKTNLQINACSHVILFSGELDLCCEKIIDFNREVSL